MKIFFFNSSDFRYSRSASKMSIKLRIHGIIDVQLSAGGQRSGSALTWRWRMVDVMPLWKDLSSTPPAEHPPHWQLQAAVAHQFVLSCVAAAGKEPAALPDGDRNSHQV